MHLMDGKNFEHHQTCLMSLILMFPHLWTPYSIIVMHSILLCLSCLLSHDLSHINWFLTVNIYFQLWGWTPKLYTSRPDKLPSKFEFSSASVPVSCEAHGKLKVCHCLHIQHCISIAHCWTKSNFIVAYDPFTSLKPVPFSFQCK